MKKISKILRQALRKSAKNLTENRRLLKEQTGGGVYGLQIVNQLDANDKCHTPLLRKCETDTNGNVGIATTCRHYPLRCMTDPQNNIYQIGDCFSWDNNDKIECIVGFAASKRGRMGRTEHTCNECSVDINPSNGVMDCTDCEGQTWTSQIPGCLDCPNCSNFGGNLPNPPTQDDGSCLGCTDSNASNYEPNADIDDGSCINVPPPITYNCYSGLCEDPGDGSGIHASLSNCITSPECDRWKCVTTQQPLSLQEQLGLSDKPTKDTGPGVPMPTNTDCYQCTVGEYDEASQTWDPKCIHLNEEDCTEECNPPPTGCTDPLALNYNPNAQVDDGSCEYQTGCEEEPNGNENQYDGCWSCHGDALGGQGSCWQPPQQWINTNGIPQGFNFYNTEADCIAAGPDCQDKEEIQCQCCDNGNPVSMAGTYPATPGCSALNGGTFSNCSLHPQSGGQRIKCKPQSTGCHNDPDFCQTNPYLTPGGECWICHMMTECMPMYDYLQYGSGPPGSVGTTTFMMNWLTKDSSGVYTTPQGSGLYCSEQQCMNETGCSAYGGYSPIPKMADPDGETNVDDFSKDLDQIMKDIDPSVKPELREGVQLKGKLLNKLRMTKLAGIKKK